MGWLEEVEQHGEPELQAFARHLNLHKEESAVQAELTLAWSNGPTEGFLHRLTLLKRQAYGRAGVALLKQRMLFHPSDRACRLTLMTNRLISEKAQDRRSKSPRFPPSVPLLRPWPRLVQPRST